MPRPDNPRRLNLSERQLKAVMDRDVSDAALGERFGFTRQGIRLYRIRIEQERSKHHGGNNEKND